MGGFWHGIHWKQTEKTKARNWLRSWSRRWILTSLFLKLRHPDMSASSEGARAEDSASESECSSDEARDRAEKSKSSPNNESTWAQRMLDRKRQRQLAFTHELASMFNEVNLTRILFHFHFDAASVRFLGFAPFKQDGYSPLEHQWFLQVCSS